MTEPRASQKVNRLDLRATPFWALSALLHLLFFLVLLSIVQQGPPEPERTYILTADVRPRPEPARKPYDPTARRDIKKQERILDKVLQDKTFVRRQIREHETILPRGIDMDRISDTELAGRFADDAIGVGGGLPGALGSRVGDGKLLAMDGVDASSEEAVRAALEWLRRHQSPDGSWRSAAFLSRCLVPCRSLDAARYGDGRGFPEHDVGVTGLAILAFAGYGQTHIDGVHPEYVECLSLAVRYLLGVQVRSGDPDEDGRFGPAGHEPWIYDHAIATMALAELLVMSSDVLHLKDPVARAVKLCLRARNDGYGWRYVPRRGDNDTSVTGWMVLALKTARSARLGIPREELDRALAGALAWIHRATSVNGKTGYMAPGDEGSRLQNVHPEPYPFSKDLSCMTAVGVLCRIFAGESRKSAAIRDGVKILISSPPDWLEPKGRAAGTINFYHWYYGSYALFQYGGPEWKRWNEAMRRALLDSQRRGGDEDGSWDPIDEWGPAGGRVYATALGAMTLEVYYRYVRLEQGLDFGAASSLTPAAPRGAGIVSR